MSRRRVVLKYNQIKYKIFKFEWCIQTLFEFVRLMF